jgi:thioredoxin reductase (NADPH)
VTTSPEPPAERRPAILAVDDEPAVLAAVARDLRRGFGERFRILRSSSGQEALEVLRELRTRGERVAMLIADQRMPGMSGTEYLVQARTIVPDAKRVLLTAYADTEAAIAAINEVALDYYLLKPWDPPEEQLFPVVEDLLTTWEAGAALESGGVRVVGHRFSKESHDLRDFLVRNRVPARWLDIERDGEARELLRVASVDSDRLPVALLEDGTVLERPTILELAERLGVAGVPAQDHYDLVVVGGGPAGLAAAVYGASEGLKTVMVEREAPGGQAGQSSRIENYLGFPAGLSGSDLARRATDQARRLGAELLTVQEAVGLRAEGAARLVELSGGGVLSASCVLVASGVSYRQLDTPGFPELTGAGVYYGAAMTEARACADQHVVVIGGANSAGQAAVYFGGYAAKVTMLVRSSLEKSMSHYLIEQIAARPTIEVRTGTSAIAAESEEGRLRRLRVQGPDGEDTVQADACFVFIGASPRTDWLEGVLARDDRGFILAGRDAQADGWPLKREPYVLETTVPGVFVAGDVRARSIKRVASAVGEGSMAVSLIHEYLVDA